MNFSNIKKHFATPFLEVRENLQIGYKSMFAIKDIPAFMVLSKLSYKAILTSPTRYTVQINEQEHIELKPEYLRYINHSCDPNVFFDTMEMRLTVLRPILAEEEITFFYPSTEWEMTESFNCACGSKHCLQHIRGAAYLTKTQIEQNKLSAYILNKYQA